MAAILESQRRYLQEVVPQNIASGATFPIDLMQRFSIPGKDSPCLNFGCGTGEKTILQNLQGYFSLGYDINLAAIETARQFGAAAGLEGVFLQET